MAFTLRFETTTAAFDTTDDDRAAVREVHRILGDVTGQVANGNNGGRVKDINGNTIGGWELTPDKLTPNTAALLEAARDSERPLLRSLIARAQR